ncbi:SCF ubiquitin ligase complex subunit cdc4 [Marasmius crinis-equi]|uniref:SCF ubiquitin ligase complex subunit cdc4 n=1 Tax=Marasmius crinis-equi TaxID=585013 RepID=A0ABR3F2J4_9AGAR
MGVLLDSESQIYASALCTLGHGYPLWIPEPNNALSAQYQESGVRIGDVGVLTDDGGFNFVFNVCSPADDPVNQFGLPPGFQPLHWDSGSRREISKRFRPGAPILSRGARTWDIAVEASASPPLVLCSIIYFSKLIETTSGFPLGGGGGIKIKFSEGKGAVVMPPNGADRVDCLDLAVFREYAQKYAVSWYEFINGTLGREVDNGAIYFITGFDNTDCWENAVVNDQFREQSCELMFTTNGLIGDARLRLSTSSMRVSVSSRCSPEDNRKQNQTLFIRGFRIAIRRKIKFLGNVKVEVRSTKHLSPDDFVRKGGKPPFGQSHSSTSSDFSNTNSSLFGSTAGNRSHTPETPSSDTDDTSSSSSVESNTPQFYHPLNAINDYILRSEDSIEVAITHDSDWISLLRDEDIFMPDSSTLIERFKTSSGFSSSSDCVSHVLLEAEHESSRQSPSVNDQMAIGNRDSFCLESNVDDALQELPSAPVSYDASPPAASTSRESSDTTMKMICSRLQARRDKLQANIPAGPTPLEDVANETKKPKKKALLIGVEYSTSGENALKGPHKDIAAMKKLLVEKYQYDPKDIVTLVDTKDVKSQKQPTHDNMITEMQKLVHGAAAGDRFFFHYSGHAIQVPNQDSKEEDGMDECIVPCNSNGSPNDANLIKDDVLKKILVDTLPTGSHLVAIFDSCHSASLLDLKHFRCNRVYVPWISKSRRKSDSMWLATVRKNAGLVKTRTIHQTSRMSNDIVKTRKTTVDRMYNTPDLDLPATPASHLDVESSQSTQSTLVASATSRPQTPKLTRGISLSINEPKPSQSMTRGRKRRSTSSFKSSYTPWFTGPGYDEPPVEQYCTGQCRCCPSPVMSRRSTIGNGRSPISAFRLPPDPPADVISLGSCKDSQTAWEDLEGSSMTKMLVDILSSDPHPTMKDFMSRLSHTMHGRLLKMHEANKEFKKTKKKWRLKRKRRALPEGDMKGAEISNFQDPQLSSHQPLDMESRLEL